MSKSHPKMIPVAVFDISSSSIAGAHSLVPKAQEEAPHLSILASTRVFSEPKEDINIELFVSSALTNLDTVINTLKKADNHKPKDIHVLLASPWFISQSRTIVYTKTTPFVCTEKLINTLIEKEVQFVVEHDMGRFGSMGHDGTIIEKQITQITLNGYTTNNPFGKKTKSLEISITVTVSPKQIITALTDHLQKGYGESRIRFTTSPYATYIVARDFLKCPNDIMLVDIGEETSDIAFVKNDLFLYQQSFPVGFYELYREVASSKHTTLTETRALIETFRLGKLSALMSSNIQKALESFSDKWGKALGEHVGGESNKIIKIPSNIYIISLQPFFSLFSTYIERDPFITHSAGATTVTSTVLDSSIFSKFISSLDPEKLDDTLTIGALFASRLL